MASPENLSVPFAQSTVKLSGPNVSWYRSGPSMRIGKTPVRGPRIITRWRPARHRTGNGK